MSDQALEEVRKAEEEIVRRNMADRLDKRLRPLNDYMLKQGLDLDTMWLRDFKFFVGSKPWEVLMSALEASYDAYKENTTNAVEINDVLQRNAQANAMKGVLTIFRAIEEKTYPQGVPKCQMNEPYSPQTPPKPEEATPSPTCKEGKPTRKRVPKKRKAKKKAKSKRATKTSKAKRKETPTKEAKKTSSEA